MGLQRMLGFFTWCWLRVGGDLGNNRLISSADGVCSWKMVWKEPSLFLRVSTPLGVAIKYVFCCQFSEEIVICLVNLHHFMAFSILMGFVQV